MSYKITLVLEEEKAYGLPERSTVVRRKLEQGEAEMDFHELVSVLLDEIDRWEDK